jgi:hypothetical protein
LTAMNLALGELKRMQDELQADSGGNRDDGTGEGPGDASPRRPSSLPPPRERGALVRQLAAAPLPRKAPR